MPRNSAASVRFANPVATAPVAFARAPQTVSADLIDYQSKHGCQTYKTGTAPLSTEKFSLDGDNIFLIIAALKTRASIMNWDATILNVPVNGVNKNILQHYSLITKAMTETHVLTYLFTESRKAQDDYLLYICLRQSLTSTADAAIQSWAEDFTLSDNNQSLVSGVMLLKILINSTQADTTAVDNLD